MTMYLNIRNFNFSRNYNIQLHRTQPKYSNEVLLRKCRLMAKAANLEWIEPRAKPSFYTSFYCGYWVKDSKSKVAFGPADDHLVSGSHVSLLINYVDDVYNLHYIYDSMTSNQELLEFFFSKKTFLFLYRKFLEKVNIID